mgnify:CR=1 FL=1
MGLKELRAVVVQNTSLFLSSLFFNGYPELYAFLKGTFFVTCVKTFVKSPPAQGPNFYLWLREKGSSALEAGLIHHS